MYQKCQDNDNNFDKFLIYGGVIMNEIEEIARQLRNQKAKEWRSNNKDKVKAINKRYWLNKARKELEKKEGK